MRQALIVVAVLGAAAALVILAAWLFQRRLIYLPYGEPGTPAEAGLPHAEAVALTTENGLRLGAWFLPSDGAVTVIVFNGNAGNRSHRAPLAAALHEAGLSVLLFDYRGYADNPGVPSERGLLADARAARAFVAEREPRQIVYFGESLGAGPAVALAHESPPAALVLRSPFTSLAAVGRRHYPLLPVDLLLRDRYPIAEQVASLEVPALVIAGGRDRIVPPAESRRVADAAAGRKRFVVIPDAGHNDLSLLAGDRFVSEILGFLADAGVR